MSVQRIYGIKGGHRLQSPDPFGSPYESGLVWTPHIGQDIFSTDERPVELEVYGYPETRLLNEHGAVVTVRMCRKLSSSSDKELIVQLHIRLSDLAECPSLLQVEEWF